MKISKKWIMLAIVAALTYIIFEFWASAEWLVVNHYEYESEKVNEELKIVVLSDLHNHEFGKENEKLIYQVQQQNPDIILLIGDFINDNSTNAEITIRLVEHFKEIAPVYFAWGNHELEYMKNSATNLEEELSIAGAIVLEKEYADIKIKNTTIRLGELYDYAFGLNEEDLIQERKEIKEYLEEFQNTENFKIMMSHRPDSFIFGDAASSWKIDLVISGHNHGGQVVIPLLGGLFGGDQGYFPDYVHGMYEKGLINIFVTSGLSTNQKPLPRFNNRPEIAVLTIS